jgi:sarcosine oxidase subunit gamma
VAEAAISWKRRSPWHGILSGNFASELDAGVTVEPRVELGLATLILRRGETKRFVAKMAELYGVQVPSGPTVARGARLDLGWAGPEQWLAVSSQRAIAAGLAVELSGIAAVSDQSNGKAILRVSGSKTRDALAKGCPLDLHPRSFRPGDTALTAIAHVPVHFWQVDEAPTYDLAVPSSMAESFWRWLSVSARAFGMLVRVP